MIRDIARKIDGDAGSAAMSMSVDRNGLVEAAARWVRCQNVIAYHGSRLTSNEVDKIMVEGIRALRMFAESIADVITADLDLFEGRRPQDLNG